MNVPDNYDKWVERDREQQRFLDMLPQCEICGESIQDDYYFEINDAILCWDCLKNNHRKSIEDFIS